MRGLLFRATATMLIFGASAALARNVANLSGPHLSKSSAAKTTIGMARSRMDKARVHSERVGDRHNTMGGANPTGIIPQSSDEGRTSGGGSGSGM